MDSYKTIDSTFEGIYKEKGSKFLAFAIPVSNLNEVKDILKHYKKEYYDARHICYAYILGKDAVESKAVDDGEPSGTAGKPILGQLRSNNLTNIMVIVVRYFGGILLGTGGLVKAYKSAAADAIHNSTVIEKNINIEFNILFEYTQLNSVMKIIKEFNIDIRDQKLENQSQMVLETRQQQFEKVQQNLNKIFGLRVFF